MKQKFDYDVIVIGAGHAGLESAFATAKLKLRTLMVTFDKQNVANCPCNPSVGGPAKGIVTREIDVLGGMQAIAADACQLQMKLLNYSKGPGVWALRAQIDKIQYNKFFLDAINKQENLHLLFAKFKQLTFNSQNELIGVELVDGSKISCKVVIITTGTYLDSITYCGFNIKHEGPNNFPTTLYFPQQLKQLGFELMRLKTGTSPRIFRDSIDFSAMKVEPGTNLKLAFSHFCPRYLDVNEQLPCYLINTNDKIHNCIKANIDKSYLLSSNKITNGPRYCPSIEDKVLKFEKKIYHQIFVEPESRYLDTIYLAGFSTSMSAKIQDELISYLPGFANAKIAKYGYSIEYVAIQPSQLYPTLSSKKIPNLFFAGQINGTSGYEEAAGQGIIAGINAAAYVKREKMFIPQRSESYIGVMIDDIVTKGVTDPYRLLTSRAEHRLYLRNDNADDRLLKYGYEYGLISQARMNKYYEQKKRCTEVIKSLKNISIGNVKDLAKISKKTNFSLYRYAKSLDHPLVALEKYVHSISQLNDFERMKIEICIKYDGYIKRSINEIKKMHNLELISLKKINDYQKVPNLSKEAVQKLNKIKPLNLGQASRISGINFNDLVTIKRFLEKIRIVAT